MTDLKLFIALLDKVKNTTVILELQVLHTIRVYFFISVLYGEYWQWHHEKKIETLMVTNSTNTNKTNEHISH